MYTMYVELIQHGCRLKSFENLLEVQMIVGQYLTAQTERNTSVAPPSSVCLALSLCVSSHYLSLTHTHIHNLGCTTLSNQLPLQGFHGHCKAFVSFLSPKWMVGYHLGHPLGKKKKATKQWEIMVTEKITMEEKRRKQVTQTTAYKIKNKQRQM